MYKQAMSIILSFSLIFLFLFPGCQPTTPDLTGGTISGTVALPGSSSKDITGYTPIPGATVTIMDAEGNTHTTLTDENGFYSFDNISVKANTIINITKDTEGGGKIVFMEVIPQALSPEENFYAGIADAESTALALVIEALLNLGQLQEEINLEAIISAPGFASLEEAVRQAQENNQDILAISSIISQAEAIADYIINPPSPTPTPPLVLSSAKEILTYKFEASKNIALSSDVAGTIGSVNYTVSLAVPYGTDVTSLVATFTLSQGATAKVGDTSQVSGTTSNDFTTPVTYTVTAEDDSTREWIIRVGGPVYNITQNIDYTTISAALSAANSGDIIEVADGTYYESITFPSNKVITLRSVNGPISTIIRCDNTLETVTCDGSLEGTALEGFTVTHKVMTSGMGINIASGYLTIKNCVISYNYTTNGGGIYNAGTLTITDSTISNNIAGWGGGIYNAGTFTSSTGTLTITDSTISNNSAHFNGGGIFNYGTLTISGSTISSNDAWDNSGGIDNAGYGTLTITDSTISNNIAGWGGGIYHAADRLTITDSTISNNSAYFFGGGIYLHQETDDITIGGNGNFNTFINNKKGTTISADQHIHNTSEGDCHWDYLDNYYSPAEVTAYKFEDSNNDALSADVEGDINPTDRTISLTVPSGTVLTELIATFTLVTGASAEVGTTPQVSGDTSNNFTIPVNYTVFKTTELDKVTNWTVTVTVASP